jgi:pilus assembly protein Flp/PilA
LRCFFLTEAEIKKILGLGGDERGVTALEYGLIVALVGLVIVGGMTLLGTDLNAIFSKAATSI